MLAKLALPVVPSMIRSVWRAPPDLRDTAVPLLWLAAGLLASYLYMDVARISSVLFREQDPVPSLPIPLFAPQAIIFSVLLLTPRRRWWAYLLAYYAMQV